MPEVGSGEGGGADVNAYLVDTLFQQKLSLSYTVLKLVNFNYCLLPWVGVHTSQRTGPPCVGLGNTFCERYFP